VIATVNSLAAAKTENFFLIERTLASVPKLKPTEKHFEHQASILELDRYAIDLQLLKFSGVAYSTASIIAKSPSPTVSPYVSSLGAINAAANAKCETGKVGLKQILPLLEERPNDVGLLLVIIQLYILTNNPAQATTLLEALFMRLESSKEPADHDVRFAPGLVALVVSLYRSTGRKAPIKEELGKAASYWRRKENSSPSLLQAAGATLLESSNPENLEAAGEIFSSLRTRDPNDRAAIAGFVASYATTDLHKASLELEKLTPVSRLISGVDAAALEDAGVPSLPVAPSQVASKKRQAETSEKEKPTKARKISKSKMPKEFVEGKQMDPERWLPLRDRSSYRPKGKKGKKKAADLTQGGVVKEEPESLELAGGAGTVKVEKSKNKKKGKK
jgi:signal recognition particle subunit SRP72